MRLLRVVLVWSVAVWSSKPDGIIAQQIGMQAPEIKTVGQNRL